VVQSLDGKDLNKSQRWVAKMVSVAENTGQKLIPASASGPAALVLDQPGSAPVRTLGTLLPGGTRATLWNGEELVVDQLNGTWEMVFSGSKLNFWSDVPGSTLHYQGRSLSSQGELPTPVPFLQVVVGELSPFAPTFP